MLMPCRVWSPPTKRSMTWPCAGQRQAGALETAALPGAELGVAGGAGVEAAGEEAGGDTGDEADGDGDADAVAGDAVGGRTGGATGNVDGDATGGDAGRTEAGAARVGAGD